MAGVTWDPHLHKELASFSYKGPVNMLGFVVSLQLHSAITAQEQAKMTHT